MAALIVAADPVLVWQSRSVMTETPAAFLVALTLAGTTSPRLVGSMVSGGLGLGLLALCRPSGLAVAGLAIAGALLVPPGAWRERLARSGLRRRRAGTVPTSLDHSQRVVSSASRSAARRTAGTRWRSLITRRITTRCWTVPPGAVWTGHLQWQWWDSVNRATAGMTEPQADRYLRDSVFRLAHNRPVEFARSVVHRLKHFWDLSPAGSVYSRGMRWAIAWPGPCPFGSRFSSACSVSIFGVGRGSWHHFSVPASRSSTPFTGRTCGCAPNRARHRGRCGFGLPVQAIVNTRSDV